MSFDEFIGIVRESFPGTTERQEEQFRQLEGLYNEWNAKINVISRKDIGGLYIHHVLHSLAIAEYIRRELPETYSRLRNPEESVRMLDLGTGGGFPGIPLAILFPGGRFTLCDSIGKKVKVAAEVSAALELGNVETVNARAESLPGQFGYIVSRAVTSLENFMPWTKGKYTEGILYLKGGDVVEEIAAAMGRFNLRKGSVHTWKIDSWLKDSYFEGKLVIFIEGKRFLGK